MSELYIPNRFTRIVAIHIIKNLMSQRYARAPLILGIHGPSGFGKTYQCEHVLNEMGVKSFLISGGQLESSEAGEPAQLVRQTYINASRCMEKNEAEASVVLINDIDTGLGDWGDLVQYTINRQTVFGELMHIVDYPTSVEGRETRRVPIIVTGNNFTTLYQPLVRAGRMTTFEWIPAFEERVKIVANIFPEITLAECEELLIVLDGEVSARSENQDQVLPTAFFTDLRSSLIDDLLWDKIQEAGLREALIYLNQGIQPIIDISINIRRLIEAGRSIIYNSHLVNHLRRTG